MLKSAYQFCFFLLVPLLLNGVGFGFSNFTITNLPNQSRLAVDYLVLMAGAQAQQEDTPASQFVQEILARGGSPSSVTLSFENMSSLSTSDQDVLKRSITGSFRSAGIRLVK